MNQKRIALISNNGPSPWLHRMSEGLERLGKVAVLTECEAESVDEADDPYDMLLLDASGLQTELAARVAWLHGRFPQTAIVVLTSSPTWRRARAVLQAGASDYVRRSMEVEMLLERCRSLLNWSP